MTRERPFLPTVGHLTPSCTPEHIRPDSVTHRAACNNQQTPLGKKEHTSIHRKLPSSSNQSGPQWRLLASRFVRKFSSSVASPSLQISSTHTRTCFHKIACMPSASDTRLLLSSISIPHFKDAARLPACALGGSLSLVTVNTASIFGHVCMDPYTDHLSNETSTHLTMQGPVQLRPSDRRVLARGFPSLC